MGKDKVYSLSDLKKEGIKLKRRKEARARKREEGRQKFKEKLAKVYKTKKFKDDTDFEKHFPDYKNMDIDPEVLKKYERDLVTKRTRKTKVKRVKLELVSNVDDYQVSPSELESESDIDQSSTSFMNMC